MKCGKYFFASLLLAFFTIPAQSQSPGSKFYVKAYGGYGFLNPGSWNLITYQTVPNPPNPDISVFAQSSSLGQGLHYGGGIGYIINEFLNVGMDAEYLSGKKTSGTDIFATSTNYFLTKTEITHSVFSIIPNITFKALSKPAYYIYTRLGIIITANIKLNESIYDSSYYSNGPYSDLNIKSENDSYQFNTSFGVQTAVGVQFRISENLRGFGEIVGQWLPARPSKLTATTNTHETIVNPPSPTSDLYTQIVTISTYSKTGVTDYKSIQSGGDGLSPSNPQIFTNTQNLVVDNKNINYIGINVGIAYRF